MHDTSTSSSSGKSAFKRGGDLFEYAAGGLLAFFMGPLLFEFTQGFVLSYAAEKYGEAWSGFFWFLWVIGSAVGSFGLSVMIMAMTVHVGLMKISRKLFGR
ncbi:membrane protein insertase Oxa1/YidC/SpoIIIJ [Sphingobium sp. OAS761]|uniref:hypothetical protein n=1 Tax=Sphingobium sp. OAS761 TaxID=2817901 RepID=UPI0020A163C2|nr:hypothetical protein [Sphingobium sp. OAS761]MCP1469480.1 membrane protein insertase Oxa1/YidC/SpoIIIJ [Sphingobium sp. OAS761]